MTRIARIDEWWDWADVGSAGEGFCTKNPRGQSRETAECGLRSVRILANAVMESLTAWRVWDLDAEPQRDKVDAPQQGDPARPTADQPKVPEKSPKVNPGAKATPPTKK